MTNYYTKDSKTILKELNTSLNGLSMQEAETRLQKYGYNAIIDKNQQTIFLKLLSKFKDIMVIILLIVALISFIVSLIKHESFLDTIIIVIVVIINAILSFIQDNKADKALKLLKKMQITNVLIKRDNKLIVIDNKYLTIGDIIYLESGDVVPADARIIECTALKVDESALTGESIPVIKDANKINNNVNITSQNNILFTGTNIVYGKCTAVVYATGMNTEFGKIAKQLNNNENEQTSLERKIKEISKYLSILIIAIIIIMFIIGLIKKYDMLEMFLISISLGVAAIPEGLPAIITIILSLGVSTLAKKKIIVRKLSSIESIGQTDVICTDKTGTITQNKITLKGIIYNNKLFKQDNNINDNYLTKAMILNNNTITSNRKLIGDAMEVSIYEYFNKKLINQINKKYPRLAEIPFDSERKMMSTINQINNNKVIFTKGSFNSIIEHSNHLLINNKIVKINKSYQNELTKIAKESGNNGYRVLAYAYKDITKNPIIDKTTENNLIFCGMVLMSDPPRPNVRSAIKDCQKLGIKTIMITGDNLETAKSIAKEVGILTNDDEIIEAKDLEKIDLNKDCLNYTVYARVTPNDKLNIIKAIKTKQKIVAMTGDGVNDAPALKYADIGIGMGINGTEVSKNVSDLILADDSFKTITTAIKEGKRIFDNIRKALVYLLTGNLTEILVVFLGIIFDFNIFIPIWLLYLNLITDSLPAISLAFEREPDNIQKNNYNNKFFTNFILARIITSTIFKTIALILVYFIGLKLFSIQIANTMSFLTLILLELIYAYSCRNLKKNIINNKLFSNKTLNKSSLILILINFVIFLTPIRKLLKIAKLNILSYLICFSIILIVFLANEISKKIITKFKDY